MEDLVKFAAFMDSLNISYNGITLAESIKLLKEVQTLITERINDFDNNLD